MEEQEYERPGHCNCLCEHTGLKPEPLVDRSCFSLVYVLGNPLCGSHTCRCAVGKPQALPTHLPTGSTQVPLSLPSDTPSLMESD